ncbi:hypothetical protein [Algoriphagus persicinus]|uniref:hypothetical protein n=1 Tax=Algoriphagus persicinus TaxID=3108754 RepID=UPI002B385F86|nr:hypothetical protein [Algoriphagus sp. E1-3-M2]MEB2786524.1 hypothetical protein [Algoriphagus sp. E1-3-M2]
METRKITFQDIIRLNNHDWDLAYDVLLYQIAKGNLIKEVMAGDQIIYRCGTSLQDHELVYVRIFSKQHYYPPNVNLRPRRKRIPPNHSDSDT